MEPLERGGDSADGAAGFPTASFSDSFVDRVQYSAPSMEQLQAAITVAVETSVREACAWAKAACQEVRQALDEERSARMAAQEEFVQDVRGLRQVTEICVSGLKEASGQQAQLAPSLELQICEGEFRTQLARERDERLTQHSAVLARLNGAEASGIERHASLLRTVNSLELRLSKEAQQLSTPSMTQLVFSGDGTNNGQHDVIDMLVRRLEHLEGRQEEGVGKLSSRLSDAELQIHELNAACEGISGAVVSLQEVAAGHQAVLDKHAAVQSQILVEQRGRGDLSSTDQRIKELCTFIQDHKTALEGRLLEIQRQSQEQIRELQGERERDQAQELHQDLARIESRVQSLEAHAVAPLTQARSPDVPASGAVTPRTRFPMDSCLEPAAITRQLSPARDTFVNRIAGSCRTPTPRGPMVRSALSAACFHAQGSLRAGGVQSGHAVGNAPVTPGPKTSPSLGTPGPDTGRRVTTPEPRPRSTMFLGLPAQTACASASARRQGSSSPGRAPLSCRTVTSPRLVPAKVHAAGGSGGSGGTQYQVHALGSSTPVAMAGPPTVPSLDLAGVLRMV